MNNDNGPFISDNEEVLGASPEEFAPEAQEEAVQLPKKSSCPRLLAPRTRPGIFWQSVWLEKKYLALCFIIPALIMWLMYICLQVYPFGEGSVLVLDLNGQYVYFFEGLRDILRGDGSLLYSFSRALGGEFMGIFAYYLASPFSLLVLLFPDTMITEALLLMFLLKVGCCGLTFGIYIEATRKRSRVPTVIFSTMYALCAYAVVMQHNTMWIDNLILLPIVMLGIENLIKYGKFKMFVISLAMAIFSNFYIGYMMCIFCVLYFFYAFYSRTPAERNPLGEDRHFAKSFGRMALYSAITVAICAALLFCTYYSLTFGKTTFSNPNYTPDQKFDWLDMVTKLFIGSYDTVRPEGLPFLYSGMLTLILLPLYFFAPHVKTREKIASGLMLAVFLLSFNISTLDMFWHGLQRPNWLNYRYSFIFCFFIVLLAYKAYERLRDIGYRKVIAVCAFLAAILLVLQKLDYENLDDISSIWLSLLIIAIYLGVLRGATFGSAEIRKTSSLVLAILVGVEMFGAGLLNMSSLGDDVVYSSRTSYRSFIDRIQPAVDKVQEQDSSFYRMEKTLHRKTNDNFTLDMNGLSNSTSTLNQETIAFLNKLGLSSKSHWSKYLGGTPVEDTLLGLKYIITEKSGDEVQEMYDELFTYNDDLVVYKNPYALSLAYGVSPDLEELDISETNSPFETMNDIVTAMLGASEQVQVFRAADSDEKPSLSDAQQASVAGHTKYFPKSEGATATVTFAIDVTSTDVLYCYFPSDYPKEANLYVNGTKSGTFFGNETFRIVELGSFRKGDRVTVTLELTEETLYIMNEENYFYYMDSEAFAENMPKLAESQYSIESFTDDHFTGTINIAEGNELVFTSIPYDKGWNIYVDGEKVDTEELLSGVIGFTAEAGEHTLEMRYRPACLTTGLAVSAVGVCGFAAAWFVTERNRKKHLAAGVPVYCEVGVPCVLPDPGAFDAVSQSAAGYDPNAVTAELSDEAADASDASEAADASDASEAADAADENKNPTEENDK